MRRQIQIILGSVLVLVLSVVSPAKAQPTIIAASPAPDEVVALPPSAVSITFDRVLSTAGTAIHVTNDQGLRVDEGKTLIDPADSRHAFVKLKPLTEGIYTVNYTAMVLGASTLTFESFT